MELFLNDKLGKITVEIDKAAKPQAVLILAHGAGAGMNHPFMNEIARGISENDITVVRFNFPYMERGRRSPGSPKENIETWRLVVDHIQAQLPGLPIFISGKSYGGRMASHLMAEDPLPTVKGLIYFGFPLHAPGKDSKDRAVHLTKLDVPQLFLQGTNDKLANIHLIKEVLTELPKSTLMEIEGADHSFNIPKKSGKTKNEVMEFLTSTTVKWINERVD